MFNLSAIDQMNLVLFGLLTLLAVGFGLQAWQTRRRARRKRATAQAQTLVQKGRGT